MGREGVLSQLYPPQSDLLITAAIVRFTINLCLPWPPASHYAQTCRSGMSASIVICRVSSATAEWAGTCMVSCLCVFFFAFFLLFFFVFLSCEDISLLLEMLVRSVLWAVNLPFFSAICKFCDVNILYKVGRKDISSICAVS